MRAVSVDAVAEIGMALRVIPAMVNVNVTGGTARCKSWVELEIAGLWNAIVETFRGWFITIVDSIEWVVESLTALLFDVVTWFGGLVWDIGFYLYDLFLGEEGFVWWIFDFALSTGHWLLSNMVDVDEILRQYEGIFDMALGFVGRLDQFVPVTEGVALVTILIGLYVIIIIVRLILKLIPGMGG